METFFLNARLPFHHSHNNGFESLDSDLPPRQADHAQHRIRQYARSRVPKTLDVNQENLDFLLSLPPKARQFHFSHEEQISLTESSRPLGRSAYGSKHHSNTSSTQISRPSLRPFSSMPHTYQASELPLRNYIPNRTPLKEIDETTVLDTSPAIPPVVRYQPARIVEEPPAEQSIIARRRRRPSLRKAISLITIPHVQPQHSTSTSPAPLLKQKRLQKHANCSPIEDHFTSPSQYYQDPEARSKLKRGLSSPQGFEEALEFGFPSSSTSPATSDALSHLTPASIQSPTSTNDMQRFLRNSTLSFMDTSDEPCDDLSQKIEEEEDDDGLDNDSCYLTSYSGSIPASSDDDSSFSEIDSPATPQEGDMKSLQYEALRSPLAGKTDSTLPEQILSPKVMRHFYDGDPDTLQRRGGWEKTLRITLTKPELRAPEEDIYGKPRESQSRDANSMDTSAFAQDQDGWNLRSSEGNRVRSLWNRVLKSGSKR